MNCTCSVPGSLGTLSSWTNCSPCFPCLWRNNSGTEEPASRPSNERIIAYIYGFDGKSPGYLCPHTQHENCKLVSNKNKPKLFLILRSSIKSLASAALQGPQLRSCTCPLGFCWRGKHWMDRVKSEQVQGPDSSLWASREPFAIRDLFLAGARRWG